MPKATRPVNGRTEMQTQVCLVTGPYGLRRLVRSGEVESPLLSQPGVGICRLRWAVWQVATYHVWLFKLIKIN